jgi:hypothetical protein
MDQTDGCATPWRTSSFSGGGNQCVEVAGLLNGGVGIRDSKNRGAGMIRVSAAAWTAFMTSIKDDVPHTLSGI